MHTFKLGMLARAGLAVAASALMAGSTAFAGDSKDVNVVNQPTVNLSDDTVRVGNDAADPVVTRTADDALRQVVQGSVQATLDSGQASAEATLYTVPEGKRLVIEFLSAKAPRGVASALQLSTTAGGTTVDHSLAITQSDYPRASEQVRLYADGGTVVDVRIGISPTIDGFRSAGFFTFSGYLVDMP